MPPLFSDLAAPSRVLLKLKGRQAELLDEAVAVRLGPAWHRALREEFL